MHKKYHEKFKILDILAVTTQAHEGIEMVIPNRKEAIRYAIEHAQEGDMITILGLGHESYQEENGIKTPHSDIQFAAQCCKECYPQG